MRRTVLVPITAGVVGVLLVALVAAVLLLSRTHHRASTSSSSVVAPAPVSARSQAPARPDDTPLITAIRAFARAYGVYLDGGPKTAVARARAGSVTSAAQATQAGQIPPAFRDGDLKVAAVGSLEQTCCSASVTVVLSNREQTYPFTEQLLLEDGRWLVDQITPTDLAMDESLKAPRPVSEPDGAETSARAFATGYVDYRSGIASTAPAMTAAAAAQITAGTASLAGQRLPRAAGRLLSIRFGPASGDEFAASSTVVLGAARLTFSFLMVHTSAGWECGQFL